MKLAIVITVTALLALAACLLSVGMWGVLIPDSYYAFRLVVNFFTAYAIGFLAMVVGSAWYEIWTNRT